MIICSLNLLLKFIIQYQRLNNLSTKILWLYYSRIIKCAGLLYKFSTRKDKKQMTIFSIELFFVLLYMD